MKNKLLITIIVIAAVLMLLNLGDRTLWGDEAHTTLMSKNLLKYGYVRMYDGRMMLGLLYDGSPILHPTPIYKEDSLAYVYGPWLEHYIIAPSLFLFGQNTFAARLPFTILGILALVMLYFFALKLTKDKKLAILSVFLLAFYIPFYLYSRQARYHSATIFFAIFVLYFYLNFLENKKYSFFFLTLGLILSFYAHYVLFFALYFTIAIHFLVFDLTKKKTKKSKSKLIIFKFFKDEKILKRLIISSAIIFLFTFPWFLYASTFTQASSAFNIIHIITSTAYSFAYLFLYTFPFILIFFLPSILFKKSKSKKIMNKNYALLVFFIVITCLMNALTPDYIPPFRFITFLFPIFMILIAKIILQIKDYSKTIALAFVLVLIFTNWFFVIPLKPFEPIALRLTEKNSDPYLFIKDNLRIRYNFFGYMYEITYHYSTAEEKICNYLKENGKEDDYIFSNSYYHVCMFYNNQLQWIPSMDSKPQWIVPGEPDSLWGHKQAYDEVISKIDEDYEKIIIKSTAYIYPLDSPHPRMHRFKENKDLTTSNIYPQETYPIEIYKLK